ncbi:inorganic phosphate transporter [Thermophilibacter immobilis]|uniref:Inorganic phosphate transporter n=1 Tax=Thermophilibacter immobilis TaxID=2779519 RepID=A0A7S7RV46_9ACTN|nr:inorganic phosphate transporter [Thermophilibacter immobilis]QOY61097.1 inorganic phosphate transporter [Thermophilibacter immobilis]
MISFEQFLGALSSNPFLLVVMLLVLGTIFVNGATDAANAIAEPVGTRSIDVDAAILMSVICNFIGLVAMSFISTAVADTMSGMVDFGGDSHAALIALAAATVGIVAWGLGAWVFGIPTSESHALIAGLTGAAIAVSGGVGGVNFSEWVKVIYGLVLSTVLGFLAGWAIAKVIPHLCANASRKRANSFFGHMQVIGAAGVALMHGAQDGQKFMSTAMLAIALSLNLTMGDMGNFPLWIEVICAAVMALGTAVGGKKIIKKVGMEMVRLDKYQGFAASVSATIALLIATLTGLPVSTTHTKTAAIMGAGAAKDPRSVHWGVAKEMVLTWVFTFPGCGIIGFVLAKLFLVLF